MAARTDAARAEAVAAREGLADELVRLEAAGRAAVDIPARLRREPAKVAGAAAGAAFLLAGGPARVLRQLRRALSGAKADEPPSMLPPEIERTLKRLGPEGARVRGALERDFARYLEAQGPKARERDLGAAAAGLLSNLLKPVTQRAGRRLAEELFDADRTTAADALREVRSRRGKEADR